MAIYKSFNIKNYIMAIKETIKKLSKLFTPKQSDNGRRLTPNEIELMSYERREYLDNVKKKLSGYRQKNFNEVILGSKIDTDSSLLKSNNIFKEKSKVKQPNILGNGNNILR